MEYDGERDSEAFWRAARPRREPALQRWYLPCILLACVASVPWYYGETARVPLLLGLPAWVWITVACSAVVSGITALAAWMFWDDEEADEGD